MNSRFQDPIVAEVRRNREAILAEFGGDMNKLHQHLAEQQPVWEAAGFHYVTEAEMQARLAWRKQRDEELERKIASM